VPDTSAVRTGTLAHLAIGHFTLLSRTMARRVQENDLKSN
jgi:hypothetical protein